MPRRAGLTRLLTSLIAAALASSSCAQNAPVDDADPEGTLTTVVSGDPQLDPVLAFQVERDVSTINMVFEPLLHVDPKTSRPVPAAAKALPDISADGLMYRLTIRDDAKYSDGTAVRARDFVYAFVRLCDPSIKATYASAVSAVIGCAEWNQLDPKKDAADKLLAAREKLTGAGVRATGEKELIIQLARPASYFSSVLGLWATAPVRESDLIHGGDTWTEPATYIGNGPFVLTTWKHGERLVLTPNRYYRAPARIKQWTKLVGGGGEAAIALGAYRHNETDVFFVLGGSAAREIEADPALKSELVRAPLPCTVFLGFNARRPPFDDPMVRLAFAKAIDRDAYLRDLGVLGTPTLSLIPPGLPGHDPADTVQRFDPPEARRLLASSRYSASDALRSIVFPHGSQPFPRDFSRWAADQWKTNLGVVVKTEQMEGPSFQQLFRTGETVPQVFGIAQWCADYPDQQDWLSLLFRSSSGSSFRVDTGFADPEFDRLVDQADGERDQARRDDLYQRASRMLSERAVLAFINTGAILWLRKPWVRGVPDSALYWALGSAPGTERIYITKGRDQK